MNFYNPTLHNAQIRFFHNANARAVDIYLDDRPIVRGLNKGQRTKYLPIPIGMYNITIRTTEDNYQLLSQKISIDGNKMITLSPTDAGSIKLIITEELIPNTTGMTPSMQQGIQPGMQQGMQPGMMPGMQHGMQQGIQPGMMPYQGYPQQYPMNDQMYDSQYQMGMMPYPESMYDENRDGVMMVPRDKAKVRFIHLSPNSPEVDVVLPNKIQLFTNVPYKGLTDYIDVNPGTYMLEVRLHGTDTVVLTLPNFRINPREIKTIYAIGLFNETPPLEAIVLNDTMI